MGTNSVLVKIVHWFVRGRQGQLSYEALTSLELLLLQGYYCSILVLVLWSSVAWLKKVRNLQSFGDSGGDGDDWGREREGERERERGLC